MKIYEDAIIDPNNYYVDLKIAIEHNCLNQTALTLYVQILVTVVPPHYK